MIKIRSLFALFVFLYSSFSFAQDASQQITSAPERLAIDYKSVDKITGNLSFKKDGIGIGVAGQGALSYNLYYSGGATWDSSPTLTARFGGTTYLLTYGFTSENFQTTDGGHTFTNSSGSGSTLVASGATVLYTRTDGTRITFANDGCCNGGVWLYSRIGGNGSPYVTSIQFPSGEVWTWNYFTAVFCQISSTEGDCPLTRQVTYKRAQSISNNFGYQLRFTYGSNVVSGLMNVSRMNWVTYSRIDAVNTAVDACAPQSPACTYSRVWPSITYSQAPDNANARLVTDTLGRVTRYTYDPSDSAELVAIRYPGSTSDDITFARDSQNRITSLTTSQGTWTYSYQVSGTVQTMTVTDPLQGKTTYVSDTSLAELQSQTDALGRKVSYTYDASQRLTQVTNPEGDAVQYTYDGRGNVTQTTQVPKPGSGLAPIVTSATYDATCTNPVTCNKPNSTTDANGKVTTYTYDPTHGGVLTVTAPAGANGVSPQTRYSYGQVTPAYLNSGGAVVQGAPVYRLIGTSVCRTTASCSNTADELRTTITYGVGGVSSNGSNNQLPVTVMVAAGDGSVSASSSLGYDAVGNVVSKTDPLGNTTAYLYDAGRQQVGVIGPDPDGGGALHYRAVRKTYNANGQATLIEQGTEVSQVDSGWTNFTPLQQLAISYDAAWRRSQVSLMVGGAPQSVTQYAYDALSRPLCVAQRQNVSAFASLPGACSQGAVGSAGPDKITQYGYDAAGQVTKVTTGVGTTLAQTTVTTTYTPDGLKATVGDANLNLTSYQYDGLNRLSQVHYPQAGNGQVSDPNNYEGYGYDAAGHVTQDRRRDGQVVSLAYDALGRPISRSVGGMTYSYAYDNLGHLLQAQVGGQATSLGYDALGHVVSESGPLGTIGYQYDAAGRQTRMAWADGNFVSYVYDAVGELTAILENGGENGGAALASYTYDDLGRRTSRTYANGVSSAYGYDAASRLNSLTLDLGGTSFDQQETFSYSPVGQILTKTASNDTYQPTPWPGGTSGFANNGLNQLTSVNDSTITYDARGNLTEVGTTTFGYDADNNLTWTSASTSLQYDALARLAQVSQSSTTRFQYAGSRLVAEYDGSGRLLRRYVPGAGTDETVTWYEGADLTQKRWLSQDERGSVVAVTDASGSTLAINTYDEYGVPGLQNQGRFQYTGQMWIAEAGIYHYKARAYAPGFGRFMQPDPSGYDAGMNLYAYVSGDPINNTDPTGLDPCGAGSVFPSDGDNINSVTEIVCTGTRTPQSGGSTSFGGPYSDRDLAADRDTEQTAPQSGHDNSPICNQALVNLGNKLANIADKTSDFSGKLEIGGLALAGVGVVSAQPELASAGLAVTATGGVLGIGAGVAQVTSGILQGLGGAGYSNAIYGAGTLGFGWLVGRLITGPSIYGYRTRSERATDRLLSNGATVTGGVLDTVTSVLDGLGPQQKTCPSSRR